MLYTRAYRNNPQTLTADLNALRNTDFKGIRYTRIIINGWADNCKGKFAIDTKEALLQYGDLNVIVVDWDKAARDISYMGAK